jgi:hypothetical protein
MATAQASVDPGFSPYVQHLVDALQAKPANPLAALELGEMIVEMCHLADSLWAVFRRKGAGGIALRVAYLFGEASCKAETAQASGELGFTVRSSIGNHHISIKTDNTDFPLFRATVRLTPAYALKMPSVPRDLYPLDEKDDPRGACGTVLAQQRGPNSGLVYLQMEQPALGTILYFQNFTSLNDYFRATGTTPIDAVGGEWPELGYGQPPSQEDKRLEAGAELVIYDALLAFRPDKPDGELALARHFLELLATVYRAIEHPATEFRDWPGRAERTLVDLAKAPEATINHYGHRYIHPYTAAEYPDVMVQASIVSALHDWSKWNGKAHPLEQSFRSGLRKFYDHDLRTLRRYLPNVGDDKDADAVDSWYLYHPLLNLGFLAIDGDDMARELFFDSMDYAIKAARHFDYCWPVQYKVQDFSVITETAESDGRGQTDVGGIYAWVMLQAFELSSEPHYLAEARAAIDKAMGLGFALNYQANLTAWGAAACMRLWRITNEPAYQEQSYVYLASFFHNCEIWESEIGHAAHYSNFMGVTCLQDAPYMAMYECFESLRAFGKMLDDSGPYLHPAARLLVSEYCRYVLHRAWFYYPDALPQEVIADEQRENNGHVDRKLSLPLEDLYADGQQAGQVGQEIYGAGAAFVFATAAFHLIEGAPFRIFCDHFVRTIERLGEKAISVSLNGGETSRARFSVVGLKRRKLPSVNLAYATGEPLDATLCGKDRIDYSVVTDRRLILKWE